MLYTINIDGNVLILILYNIYRWKGIDIDTIYYRQKGIDIDIVYIIYTQKGIDINIIYIKVLILIGRY